MNIFDDMPDIGACPHCDHAGEGLQFAFSDEGFISGVGFTQVQAACLSCGCHGPTSLSYGGAVEAFRSGEVEVA